MEYTLEYTIETEKCAMRTGPEPPLGAKVRIQTELSIFVLTVYALFENTGRRYLNFTAFYYNIYTRLSKADTPVLLVSQVTVDPVYNKRVGAAKSVHLRRVFTINVFNLTIN
jgi:hypothetical protein